MNGRPENEKPRDRVPDNVHVHFGDKNERSFFDRHFGAFVAAAAVVLAAAIGAGLLKNDAPEISLAIIPETPFVGDVVQILFAGTRDPDGSFEDLEFKAMVYADEGKGTGKLEGQGDVFIWRPKEPGEYIVVATVEDPDGGRAARSNRISVVAQKSVPEINAAVTKTFVRQIGNPGSCSEVSVTKDFDVCLAEGFKVVDWKLTDRGTRSGGASTDEHPVRKNCAVLTLTYSDSGLGFFGDCKGNGWVNYSVELIGTKIN